MQQLGIYCSASPHIRPLFREEAVKLGSWMGKKKYTLVNGGSCQGLMEVFSKSVKENGGVCIGVIPEGFTERGWLSTFTDQTIVVKSLSERKEVIKNISDVLLVFPGGIGTLDEFFDAWASYNLGFHHKKIILINIDGFFNFLLEQLSLFKKEHFIHDFLPNPLFMVSNVDQTLELLELMATESENESILKYAFQIR